MRIYRSLISLGLSVVAIAAPILPALAGVFKDVDGDTTVVWIDDLTPGGSYSLSIDGVNRTRTLTANACGWLQLSFSFGETPPTQVKIAADAAALPGATAINTAAFPENDLACRNGVVLDAAGNTGTASDPFIDRSGRMIFPGYTANSRRTLEYVGVPNTRTRRADNCGLIRIIHRPDNPNSNMSGFNFNGTAYTLTGLTQSREVRCRNYRDGTSQKLVPTPL